MRVASESAPLGTSAFAAPSAARTPSSSVNISIEFKLHGDIRAAELTEGGHLRYTGDAAEHPLEWSGNGRGHRFGACTRQIGKHGNRRILNLRQRRHGKKGERQCTE